MLFKRPILKLEKSGVDKLIEAFTFIIIIFIWGYTLLSYNNLPGTIPIHYNFKGEIDGYGSKDTIWLIPIIVTFLVTGLFFLNKHPHIFNYTGNITEENARWNYMLATRLLRMMQLLIAFFFLLINMDIIHSAKAGRSWLSAWFIPVFLFSMLIPTIITCYMASKKKSRMRKG